MHEFFQLVNDISNISSLLPIDGTLIDIATSRQSQHATKNDDVCLKTQDRPRIVPEKLRIYKLIFKGP